MNKAILEYITVFTLNKQKSVLILIKVIISKNVDYLKCT